MKQGVGKDLKKIGKNEFVHFAGNMMQCVVLDGNLLDEDVLDGNLLDEFPLNSNLCVNNVNMTYLQSSSEVTEKGIHVSARAMMKMICHKAYAGFLHKSSVYIVTYDIYHFSSTYWNSFLCHF